MFSAVKDKVVLVASVIEGLDEARSWELEKRLVEPEYQPENDESSVGRSVQTLFMQLSDIGDSVCFEITLVDFSSHTIASPF